LEFNLEFRIPNFVSPMSETLYWLTQTLADVPEGDDWLCDGERAVLEGLRFPKRRNDWLLGRWTLKRAINSYQPHKDSALSSLEIRAAEDGAPEAFRHGEPAGVSISISHSNNRSMCVAGSPELPVGCDLEMIEQREIKFFEDYFAPEEIALLQNSSAERNLVAYLIWSAKETILKILRQGLRRDTRSVLIHPDFSEQEDSWRAWTGQCLESSRTFGGWWRAGDGFVYSLAAGNPTSFPKQIVLLNSDYAKNIHVGPGFSPDV
jgi:4'-phosphopantetheinyl transferase